LPAHRRVIGFLDRQHLERVSVLLCNRQAENSAVTAGGKPAAQIVTVTVIAARKSALRRNTNRLAPCMAKPVVFIDKRQPGMGVKRDRDDLQWLEIPARHTCSIAATLATAPITANRHNIAGWGPHEALSLGVLPACREFFAKPLWRMLEDEFGVEPHR
jgi:hypothetical protein